MTWTNICCYRANRRRTSNWISRCRLLNCRRWRIYLVKANSPKQMDGYRTRPKVAVRNWYDLTVITWQNGIGINVTHNFIFSFSHVYKECSGFSCVCVWVYFACRYPRCIFLCWYWKRENSHFCSRWAAYFLSWGKRSSFSCSWKASPWLLTEKKWHVLGLQPSHAKYK